MKKLLFALLATICSNALVGAAQPQFWHAMSDAQWNANLPAYEELFQKADQKNFIKVSPLVTITNGGESRQYREVWATVDGVNGWYYVAENATESGKHVYLKPNLLKFDNHTNTISPPVGRKFAISPIGDASKLRRSAATHTVRSPAGDATISGHAEPGKAQQTFIKAAAGLTDADLTALMESTTKVMTAVGDGFSTEEYYVLVKEEMSGVEFGDATAQGILVAQKLDPDSAKAPRIYAFTWSNITGRAPSCSNRIMQGGVSLNNTAQLQTTWAATRTWTQDRRAPLGYALATLDTQARLFAPVMRRGTGVLCAALNIPNGAIDALPLLIDPVDKRTPMLACDDQGVPTPAAVTALGELPYKSLYRGVVYTYNTASRLTTQLDMLCFKANEKKRIGGQHFVKLTFTGPLPDVYFKDESRPGEINYFPVAKINPGGTVNYFIPGDVVNNAPQARLCFRDETGVFRAYTPNLEAKRKKLEDAFQHGTPVAGQPALMVTPAGGVAGIAQLTGATLITGAPQVMFTPAPGMGAPVPMTLDKLAILLQPLDNSQKRGTVAQLKRFNRWGIPLLVAAVSLGLVSAGVAYAKHQRLMELERRKALVEELENANKRGLTAKNYASEPVLEWTEKDETERQDLRKWRTRLGILAGVALAFGGGGAVAGIHKNKFKDINAGLAAGDHNISPVELD